MKRLDIKYSEKVGMKKVKRENWENMWRDSGERTS